MTHICVTRPQWVKNDFVNIVTLQINDVACELWTSVTCHNGFLTYSCSIKLHIKFTIRCGLKQCGIRCFSNIAYKVYLYWYWPSVGEITEGEWLGNYNITPTTHHIINSLSYFMRNMIFRIADLLSLAASGIKSRVRLAEYHVIPS